MSSFLRSERRNLRHLDSNEQILSKEVKRERKTLLSKIRQFSSKKIIIVLISTMSFMAKYNTAYADTDKVKSEIIKFHGWFLENEQKMKEGTISWETVIDKFEEALENLEKEVRDDIKKHNYEKAFANLRFFYKLADSLGDSQMKRTINILINEVEAELANKNKAEGIYNVNEKVCIIEKVRTSNYEFAEREALSNARVLALREVAKMRGENQNSIIGTVHGSYILKAFREGENGYKFIIMIDLVNDAETTRQLLSHIPKTVVQK